MVYLNSVVWLLLDSLRPIWLYKLYLSRDIYHWLEIITNIDNYRTNHHGAVLSFRFIHSHHSSFLKRKTNCCCYVISMISTNAHHADSNYILFFWRGVQCWFSTNISPKHTEVVSLCRWQQICSRTLWSAQSSQVGCQPSYVRGACSSYISMAGRIGARNDGFWTRIGRFGTSTNREYGYGHEHTCMIGYGMVFIDYVYYLWSWYGR